MSRLSALTPGEQIDRQVDRGKGIGCHPNGYSIDRYSHCCQGLIEYLGVPQVHLLGFVAQRSALEHPERLASGILYDSAPAAGAGLFAEATRNIEAFAVRNSHRLGAQSALEAWRTLGTASNDEATNAKLRQLLPAFFANYWGREQELIYLPERIV